MPATHTSVLSLNTPFSLVQAGTLFSGTKRAAAPTLLHDVHYGGMGRVVGTVKNTPSIPVFRRVMLMEERNRAVIRETWSEPITGIYTFNSVSMQTTYTVVSYDHTQTYGAVIADRVIPETMP